MISFLLWKFGGFFFSIIRIDSNVGLTWVFAKLQTNTCLSSIHCNNPLLFPWFLNLLKALFLKVAVSGPSLLELDKGSTDVPFSLCSTHHHLLSFSSSRNPRHSPGLQTKDWCIWKGFVCIYLFCISSSNPHSGRSGGAREQFLCLWEAAMCPQQRYASLAPEPVSAWTGFQRGAADSENHRTLILVQDWRSSAIVLKKEINKLHIENKNTSILKSIRPIFKKKVLVINKKPSF